MEQAEPVNFNFLTESDLALLIDKQCLNDKVAKLDCLRWVYNYI